MSKPNVFILEGPDGSGKSALIDSVKCYNRTRPKPAKIVSKHLTYYKDPNKMLEEFRVVHELIKEAKENPDTIYLIDRYILSNIVYGNVYHKGEKVIEYETFLNDLKQQHVVTVFCLLKDYNKYEEHYTKLSKVRDEMYPNVFDMSRVYYSFKTLTDVNSFNHVIYDFTEKSYQCLTIDMLYGTKELISYNENKNGEI